MAKGRPQKIQRVFRKILTVGSFPSGAAVKYLRDCLPGLLYVVLFSFLSMVSSSLLVEYPSFARLEK